MARCTLCQKSPVAGSAVSHSQVHTKRRFKPNLQKVNGLLLCTRCLKAIKKTKRVEEEAEAERALELQKAKEKEEMAETTEIEAKPEPKPKKKVKKSKKDKEDK